MSPFDSPVKNSKETIAMPAKKTASRTNECSLVSKDTLTLQDAYYAERRLPPMTPSEAQDRTYCFRVEFEHDLYPITHMLRWATEAWWSSPVCPWGDADVKVTLKPDTLTTDELRWLLARIGNCHVAVETVELERNYSGDRRHQTEEDLPMTVPSTAALKASMAGLANYRESLSAATETALEAEAELEVELNTRYFAKRAARAPRIPAKPVTSTRTRSKRAST